MPEAGPAARPAASGFVLVRHGETTYNVRGLLNGDPAVPVHLSARGRRQCRALAPGFAVTAWRACVVTRFVRTHESAALMLPAAGPSPRVLAELDDIDVGEFEGRSVADYRAWRADRGLDAAPDGGESRLDAMRRYARGLARLAAELPTPALVVTHDQPIRYVENALRGESPVTGSTPRIANAVPYRYDAAALRRAAELIAAATA
jgi:broad specificity phosphatase PhoE